MNFEDMQSDASQFKDLYTIQPSEFAAEFQGVATPSHLEVYSYALYNWSL